ncbi:MAG: glycosyltransferase N-terminal domain-containing protein [Candidatus Wallbacteria bacterium]|nr:glycosyltransferase N-terminal domain-containing protein [Candidatus Wallbacteria bacterium]
MALIDLAYLFFLLLCSPLILVYLYNKELISFANFKSWLGFVDYPELDKPVVFFTVSFGEFRNIAGMAERASSCLVLSPDTELVAHLKKNWENLTRRVMLAPLDFSFAVGKMLDTVQPRKIVVSEVDLWPNLMLAAKKRYIPLFWLNVRLSNANRQLLRFFSLYRICLKNGNVYPKDELNQRFLNEAGIICRLPVNFKLLPGCVKVAHKEKLLIAGSTHFEDEKVLFAALREIRKQGFRVALAPRNVERCRQVLKDASNLGFTGKLLSSGENWYGDFLLIDRMGVLAEFYGRAQFAFVGGSFLNLGGHNILEPAQAGCRVIYGPFMRNFAIESELLERLRIGVKISDAAELISALESVVMPDWDGFDLAVYENMKKYQALEAEILRK